MAKSQNFCVFNKLDFKYFKILTLILMLFAFFLMRPYQLEISGLKYGGDDDSYFSHATSLVYGDFPSYKNEYFTSGATMPMHAVGSGVMASPFVFVFSLIDRIQHNPIIHHRTLENNIPSWSLFGFVFATVFYFCFACFLLYRGLRFYFDEKSSFYTVLLIYVFQGFLLYVFRRPVYSHIYELFCQTGLFYFLMYAHAQKVDFFRNWIRNVIYIGLLCGLVAITRYNNCFYAILWPIAIFYFSNIKSVLSNIRYLFVCYLVGAVVVSIFLLLPLFLDHYAGYGGAMVRLISPVPISIYINSLVHIFLGIDFGMIFTSPFILIGLYFLLVCKHPLKKNLILVALLLLINLWAQVSWDKIGTWYGQRFIIFSAAPFSAFGLCYFLNKTQCRWIKYLLILSIIPVTSMLVYEGNATNLTLRNIPPYGWNNYTYQYELWKIFFFHPIEFFSALLKAGPLYIVSRVAILFHLTQLLPAPVLSRYASFHLITLIRILIIYLIPGCTFYVLSFIFYRPICKTYTLEEKD